MAEELFDAPIPGISLTHELGARPWQQPAQFPTVDEAIEYYMNSMATEEFMDQILRFLKWVFLLQQSQTVYGYLA